MSSSAEAVKVVVRCRPMNAREIGLQNVKIVDMDQKTMSVTIKKLGEKDKSVVEKSNTFTYDAVFDETSTQVEVYESTAYSLINNVFDGYNGTIFAYGQTGCGKSHTMEGVRNGAPELQGIIPRSFEQVFRNIGMNTNQKKQFLVACSYVEIYNEEVRDLMSSDFKKRLEIKEDTEKGIYIKGLTETTVTNVEDMARLMADGNANRSVGATAMNATSSRSHSIFTIRIETSEPSDVPNAPNDEMKRQSKTQASGARLLEATKINQSLSTLGKVIEALVKVAEGKKETHIPYRESKLTRLLQDSLGGNTKTVMIAALSPAEDNYDETLSTLRYANRAKNIKNKPKINEDPKDAMLREYQDEIKRLKALLEGRGLDAAATQPKANAATGDDDTENDDSVEQKTKTKKKKKKATSDTTEAEEEYDDEEEEENVPTTKAARVPKPRKAMNADGEEIDSDEETIGNFVVSDKEKAKIAAERAEFTAELEKMRQEKLKHEQFAQVLEQQMRAEHDAARVAMMAERDAIAEQLRAEQSRREQTSSEKSELEIRLCAEQARLNDEQRQRDETYVQLQQQMTREKEEHERRAMELAAEMKAVELEAKIKLEQMNGELTNVKQQSDAQARALKNKLKKMQSKLLSGVEEAAQRKLIQEETIKKMEIEKKELAIKEAAALKLKQETEDKLLLVQESYDNIHTEAAATKKKLQRLGDKFRSLQDEFTDYQSEKENELEELRERVRTLEKTNALNRTICDTMLTITDYERITYNSTYDDEEQRWTLPDMDVPIVHPVLRLYHAKDINTTQKYLSNGQRNPHYRRKVKGANGNSSRDGSASNKKKKAESTEIDDTAADAGWKKCTAKQIAAEYENERALEQHRGVALKPMAPSSSASNSSSSSSSYSSYPHSARTSSSRGSTQVSSTDNVDAKSKALSYARPSSSHSSQFMANPPPSAVTAGNSSMSAIAAEFNFSSSEPSPTADYYGVNNKHGDEFVTPDDLMSSASTSSSSSNVPSSSPTRSKLNFEPTKPSSTNTATSSNNARRSSLTFMNQSNGMTSSAVLPGDHLKARPAFAPAGKVTTTSTDPSQPESNILHVALPPKRPAFAPAGGAPPTNASLPITTTQLPDSVNTIPARAAFNPVKVDQSRATNTIGSDVIDQIAFPASRPAFEPASSSSSILSTAKSSSTQPAEEKSSSSNDNNNNHDNNSVDDRSDSPDLIVNRDMTKASAAAATEEKEEHVDGPKTIAVGAARSKIIIKNRA